MTLLDALRNHLIGQGIVRKPAVAGAAPPLWLEPDEGAPAPGEGTTATEINAGAVLAAFLTGGIAPERYETFIRRDTVDIWIRTRTAPIAFDLDARVRRELADRRNWNMGGMRVIESSQFRPLQRLASDRAQGGTRIVSYLFATYSDEAFQTF